MPDQRQNLCVEADRRVRPCRNAPLFWMTDAGQMSNSLCRGGLPRPPALTTCLSCFQLTRVVGASRSCRSRRYTLVPLLSVATLSSPGPRAQHPTSHRVGRLVTDDLAFDGNKFCVVAYRCVRPCWRTEHIQSIEQRKCISYFHRPLVGAGLCACPFGVSVIVARGQAWKPAATRNNYLFTTHLSLYQAD